MVFFLWGPGDPQFFAKKNFGGYSGPPGWGPEFWRYKEDIRDVKLKKAGGIQIQQKGDILKEMLYNSVHQSSHDESHSMSEIVVHQFIETIEYVLGTVSNTASYLRLWALSLAHSQLSAVFFEKLLEPWIKSGNGIALFFAFPIFASITLGVLMCMDSMEWFLHTLRLHWVEFQNKFFSGNGYKFNGFWLRKELKILK